MIRNKTSSGRKRLWFLPFVLLLSTTQGLSQEPALEFGGAGFSADLPEYQVGPGDVLAMHIFGLEQLDQTVRVSNSGRIHIANVGVVPVANLTAAQIEGEITRKLRERQLLNDPWVRIRVIEYQSQPVYAVGEVNAPGQFMITGEMRLLDVIGRAGGLSLGAADEGFLLRRRYRPRVGVNLRYESAEALDQGAAVPMSMTATDTPPSWERFADEPSPGETVRINLEELRDGSRPDLNLRLQGGDVFFVPRRQRQHVYIVGEVLFPGAYGLPREWDHLSAAQVVSYAGGPLRTARSGKAFIMRRGQDGEVEGIPFDFTAIIRGEEPDVDIRPDDIIFVPRSVGKTVGYKMLDLVAHLTQQFIIF
jgi:polysaccharide biosynthesis/export protein